MLQYGSLYGPRVERFRGALSASLLVHAAFAVTLYILLTMPAPTSQLADAPRQALAGLVFLSTPGPGGGGGGGGNRSPEPPRRLETPGTDQLAIPVFKAAPLTPPDTETKPQETPQAMLLPVRPMDAGQLNAVGVIDNPNLAPTTSQGSGTEGGAGTGPGTGSGPGRGPGWGPGQDGGLGGKVYQVGNDVSMPVLLREVKPAYTADAMRVHLQGEVLVAAVVLPDGTVNRLRVVRSLDPTYGLDQQALVAVRQWRFKPGTRLGQPVAVQIQVAVGFSMR